MQFGIKKLQFGISNCVTLGIANTFATVKTNKPMSSFFTHLIRAFFVGILVFIILTSIQIWTGSVFVLNKNVLLNFLYTEAYSIILYLINYYTVKFLIDRFGKHLFKLKNIVLGIVLNVLATAIGIFFLRLFTEVFVGGQSLVQFLSSENPITYWLSLTIAITITSIFYIVYNNQQKQEIAVKTERIIAGTASAKFDALKNQLDPHFLFNSLTAIFRSSSVFLLCVNLYPNCSQSSIATL